MQRRWNILREQNARTGVHHDVRSSSRRVRRAYGRSSFPSCSLRWGVLGSWYPRSSGRDAGSHHRHESECLGYFERLYRRFLHAIRRSLLCRLHRCYSTFLHLHRIGKPSSSQNFESNTLYFLFFALRFNKLTNRLKKKKEINFVSNREKSVIGLRNVVLWLSCVKSWFRRSIERLKYWKYLYITKFIPCRQWPSSFFQNVIRLSIYFELHQIEEFTSNVTFYILY